MALWGNNDAVGSGGTVTLDYSNKVVSGWAGTATGTGTIQALAVLWHRRNSTMR